MVTGFPRWDFSTIDHRGHWVPKTEATGHWLSQYATMGAYHRERETEGMSEDWVDQIEAAYPLLRGGRSSGFLDVTDCGQATDEAFAVAAAVNKICAFEKKDTIIHRHRGASSTPD